MISYGLPLSSHYVPLTLNLTHIQIRTHIHTHPPMGMLCGRARIYTATLSRSRGRAEGEARAPLRRQRLLQRHHHRPGRESNGSRSGKPIMRRAA